MKLTQEQKRLRKKILKICYKKQASHIGSCLSAVDILMAVYLVKKSDEKFVLSSGHTAIALYILLEKYGYLKQAHIRDFHLHPDRNPALGIHVSTGSLGQGLPIAVGMALANREKKVFCVISDGECSEGSVWEALRIIGEQKLINVKIVVNANGYGAYGELDNSVLIPRFQSFGFSATLVDGHNIKLLKKSLQLRNTVPHIIVAQTNVNQLPFLNGQDAHYKIISRVEYEHAQRLLL